MPPQKHTGTKEEDDEVINADTSSRPEALTPESAWKALKSITAWTLYRLEALRSPKAKPQHAGEVQTQRCH